MIGFEGFGDWRLSLRFWMGDEVVGVGFLSGGSLKLGYGMFREVREFGKEFLG